MGTYKRKSLEVGLEAGQAWALSFLSLDLCRREPQQASTKLHLLLNPVFCIARHSLEANRLQLQNSLQRQSQVLIRNDLQGLNTTP